MNHQGEPMKKEYSESIYHELGRYLFQSSIVPMIMVDTKGIIVKVNSAYEEWCGYSSEELVGRYMPDRVAGCRTHIVASTGIAELHQVQYTFGKTILSSRIPIFDTQGQLIGAWGMVEVNNYDEINRLTQRIEQQKKRIRQYENTLRSYQTGKYTLEDILGHSDEILRAKQDVLTVAKAQVDAILYGETGTGKELFAHAVHNAGPRSSAPFISINCSALSPNLVESELFGYEAGSFTNASKEGRQGKFELANGGTLFLDEVGDMPMFIQPKLLRVLEEREVNRVGGNNIIPLDIQIIAATNCDLEHMVEQGTFRRDLYYRLSSYIIHIPPLRGRKKDIVMLAHHFAKETSRKLGRQALPFSDSCVEEMLAYDWPGNVRELCNYVRNLVIRSKPDDPVYESHQRLIPITFGPEQADKDAALLDSFERKAIVQALKEADGNISQTARILGVDRNTVYRKMKKYHVKKDELT